MNHSISLEHVHKTYRDFWGRSKATALTDVSLQVVPGRVVGLIGPNGAGKTTTLKIMLGLATPTSGTVRLLDSNPEAPVVRRRIGYLPEESPFHGFLTVHETLEFYGRLFSLPRPLRTERIAQLLAMLGLVPWQHRPIRELSKGTVRRVGLAQALINNPAVLILDEPTSGLDPLACRMVKDLLVALARQGRTVLICSHLLADVEGVCDRIVLLHEGRVRADGPLGETLANHESWRLTLPSPGEKDRAAVIRAIRDLTGSEPDTATPTLSLEDYFLRQTRSDGSSIHPLAPFLMHD